MQRRGFLQGLFGGITSAGLLIKAKASEVEAFAAPLTKQEPLIIDNVPAMPDLPNAGVGEHLYNSLGERVAIVTSLIVESEPTMIDTTSFRDISRSSYAAALASIRIEAVGIGRVEMRDRTGPKLRGRK